jgi:hypothetical protein
VGDIYLKEFYLLLFNYLYADLDDYAFNLNYLKRKIKLCLIEKYEKYVEYLVEKEEANKRLDNFEKERDALLRSETQLEIDYKKLLHTQELKKELLAKLINKANEES